MEIKLINMKNSKHELLSTKISNLMWTKVVNSHSHSTFSSSLSLSFFIPFQGSIFHVQVNVFETLEHALLYSIGVNLPAHRVGQLDRVLVLASPVNDINLHAWDLNRIQRFLQLDIGIRMELCSKCLRSSQTKNITFILEKMFIQDCMKFLCREARIETQPVNENGFQVYNVPHKCLLNTVPESPPPPPYSNTPPILHPKKGSAPPPPLHPKGDAPSPSLHPRGDAPPPLHPRGNALPPTLHPKRNSLPPLYPKGMPNHNYDEVILATPEDPTTERKPPPSTIKEEKPSNPSLKPIFQFPDALWDDYSTGSTSGSASMALNTIRTSSFTESLFLSDGVLTTTHTISEKMDLPPRTIPRKNHETSIPASSSQSSSDFHHKIFNTSGKYGLETPYQINSRIIITDNGDVQYERNVLGNRPSQANGGFHFKRSIPLPPRKSRVEPSTGLGSDPSTSPSPVGSDSMGPQEDSSKNVAEVKMKRRVIPGLHTSTDFKLHANSAGDVTINATLSSVPPERPPPPRPPRSTPKAKGSKTHTMTSSLATDSSSTSLKSQTNSNNGTSVVTKKIRTKMEPPVASPMKNNTTGKKQCRRTPIPPLLNRTTSESGVNLFREQKQTQIDSHSATTNKRASQSSFPDYEEDNMYVIVSPPSIRTTNAPSPSYANALDCIPERGALESKSTEFSADNDSVFPEKSERSGGDLAYELDRESTYYKFQESHLSLADAGNVIRKDWIESLENLRRERTRRESERSQELENDSAGGKKLDLNEVAYSEYKEKYTSDYVSNSGHVGQLRLSSWNYDDIVISPSSSRLSEDRSEAPQSHSSHTHLPHLHNSNYIQFNSSVSMPGPSSTISHDHILATNSRGPGRPPKPRKKPVAMPRNKSVSATSERQSHSDSSRNSDSIPGGSPSGNKQATLKFVSSDDQDYVKDISIPNSSKKPKPVLRNSNKLDSSLGSSMVTMGIMSSSESDLLEAVFKNPHQSGHLSTSSYWNKGSNLQQRYHSNIELSTSNNSYD